MTIVKECCFKLVNIKQSPLTNDIYFHYDTYGYNISNPYCSQSQLVYIYFLQCKGLFENIVTLSITNKIYAGEFLIYIKFFTTLKILQINHASITDCGMAELNEYLIRNRTLEELDLSYTDFKKFKIQKMSVNSIIKITKFNYSNVDEILISSNLDQLEMKGNCLGDTQIDNAYAELSGQERALTISALNLADNQLTSKSTVNIISIVQKCKVKYLNISQNKFNVFSGFENHIITTLTLKELDISCNDMEIHEDFVCFLQNSTQLEVLNLKKNNITHEKFKYLATGFLFTNELTLQELKLEGNPFMDKLKNKLVLQMIAGLRLDMNCFKCPPSEFEAFLAVLELVDSVNNKPNNVIKTISGIRDLDISYDHELNSCNQQMDIADQMSVKLQSCDIKVFCNYLKYFKSLESVNMIDNNIEEDVMDDLAIAVLRNFSIIEVHLEGNPIHKIRKCCKLFETIQKLRKCGNACAFRGLSGTLEALVNILHFINNFDDKICDITENIEQLDISSFYRPQHDSERIEDNPEEISTGLINHLKLFRKLVILNLSNAYLTSDALQELSRFLCNNNTLQQLNLSYNNIQAEGALVILKSFHTNTTCRTLNLNNNGITGYKCQEIATIICGLPEYISVDILRGNELTKESRRIIELR